MYIQWNDPLCNLVHHLARGERGRGRGRGRDGRGRVDMKREEVVIRERGGRYREGG